MTSIRFDRYPRYAELSAWLEELVAEHPDLLELSTIGRSYEGREIWLVTATDRSTGPHDEKPAIWIDGNIHASEVTASVACLHLLHHLVSGHGNDDDVTRALRTRTFYVAPRVNPDGAELALAELPEIVRSTVRPWPRIDQLDGFVQEDLDKDGRLLQMRVEDPNGTWKRSAADPRLLVARGPTEDGAGPYYRLLREGRIEGYDGVHVQPAPPRRGIDMNRNFPIDWQRWDPASLGSGSGAGDYPASEPEVRAVVQGLVDRPNVTAYMAYHTYSGVHLHPYGHRPDESLPTFDRKVFKALGEAATAITGYPAFSVWSNFRYDPKEVITGVADDWAYDHLGLVAWTTEFWNVVRTAGVEMEHLIYWYDDHPEDDELKLLAWVDEHIGPEGFVEWYEFDHPQLGPVELGGWNHALVFRNPPPHLLEAEVAPHSTWAVHHALCSPLLRLRTIDAEDLGGDLWRVRLVVENAGWLPTNVTARALEQKVVLPLEARLSLPSGAVLVVGDERQELGQLTGRALRTSAISPWGQIDGTTDRAKAEWTVRAAAGSTVSVEARHPRAGVVRAAVTLG